MEGNSANEGQGHLVPGQGQLLDESFSVWELRVRKGQPHQRAAHTLPGEGLSSATQAPEA